MKKINLHIEIVRTNTSGLSSMSKESCDSILSVLTKHYTKAGVTIINSMADLEALVASKPDVIFLGMKFLPSDPALGLQDPNKIWLTDYLDGHGITYTGSGQPAHELELNKPLAKQRVLEAGLKTSSSCVIRQNQSFGAGDIPLAYPVFIKPASRGGGLGIDSASVAYNFEQLRSKVLSITTDLQSDALIESYLPGREFSVAILKNEYPTGFSVMPLELVAPMDERGARMLSGEVKSANSEVVSAVTEGAVKSGVCELAINVFNALGAQDYGRIDIRLDRAGVPHFLEANLLPSLISGYGSFPKACELNINLDHRPMVLAIVQLAIIRSTNTFKSETPDTMPLHLDSVLAV